MDVDGRPLRSHAAAASLREAVDLLQDRLNLTDRPFLFFADTADGRGRLLYHRYDGHYGLITPAG